jgi:hypothetical protein
MPAFAGMTNEGASDEIEQAKESEAGVMNLP